MLGDRGRREIQLKETPTIKQLELIQLIGDRMEEIGLPRDHCFGQGDLTAYFVDLGMVLVSRTGCRKTPLYSSHRKLSVVFEECPWILKEDEGNPRTG